MSSESFPSSAPPEGQAQQSAWGADEWEIADKIPPTVPTEETPDSEADDWAEQPFAIAVQPESQGSEQGNDTEPLEKPRGSFWH